jgi:transglutaminase-like putative cysteine protease
MKLHILHETRYDYTPAVASAQHLAHLRPRSGRSQQLLSHALGIEPQPLQCSESVDAFGNTRTHFALPHSHTHLRVHAQSLVQTQVAAASHSAISWEAARDRLAYRSGQPYHEASVYAFASPAIELRAEFSSYAAASFAPGTPLLLAAQDLMARIHRDFLYDSQSTAFHTTALQVLAQRKGVCQDFSHLMLSCLRTLGLAARYVSGYVLTQPPPGQTRLLGGDASHAWVSVCLPDAPVGADWCDFDPTNNRWGWDSPGEDYVQLALGRDVTDVSPLRGVIQGRAHQSLQVNVTVQSLG